MSGILAKIKICAGQTPIQRQHNPAEDDKATLEKVNHGHFLIF